MPTATTNAGRHARGGIRRMIGIDVQLEVVHSMKPTELPPQLRPACRRVMLRHAAALARDMLDYAEDLRLTVSPAMLESIEHSALGELAAAGDTIEKAAADMRLMPREIVAAVQKRPTFRAQLRQMCLIIRVGVARQDHRPLVESAWRSLADDVATLFMAAAPLPPA